MSVKWWNTRRSETPACSAIDLAVGSGSPSRSSWHRASATLRRVRWPRATRPSLAGSSGHSGEYSGSCGRSSKAAMSLFMVMFVHALFGGRRHLSRSCGVIRIGGPGYVHRCAHRDPRRVFWVRTSRRAGRSRHADLMRNYRMLIARLGSHPPEKRDTCISDASGRPCRARFLRRSGQGPAALRPGPAALRPGPAALGPRQRRDPRPSLSPRWGNTRIAATPQ